MKQKLKENDVVVFECNKEIVIGLIIEHGWLYTGGFFFPKGFSYISNVTKIGKL